MGKEDQYTASYEALTMPMLAQAPSNTTSPIGLATPRFPPEDIENFLTSEIRVQRANIH
jgi:hypothetical protein